MGGPVSGRLPIDDPGLRLAVEWGSLWPIMMARRDKAEQLLARVSAVLPSPLARWFAHPVCRALAVAMDAALRQQTQPTSEGVLAYLAGLPHATMFEMVTGKPVMPWKAVEFDQSALAAIGGYNAAEPSEETQQRITGDPAAAALTLRSLVERDDAIELMREAARRISQCDLKAGPSAEVADLVARLASQITGRSHSRSMGECLENAVLVAERAAEQRQQGQAPPVTWGIPQLDLLCPLRPGRVYVLSAPPGHFKTSLAIQCGSATAAVIGKDAVAISSMEMTGEDLALKLVARELGLATQSIEDWTPAAAAKKDRILQIANQWKESSSMQVRDQATTGRGDTAEAVCGWFRQRKAASAGRLGLCIIDYLGLLVGKPGTRSFDVIEQATRTIKQAAMSLRVPILLLAQMNREGRKADRDKTGALVGTPEPRIEDLRGSGSIEQDADAVIFLHFPNRKRHDTMTQGKVIVAKQRGGATGELDVTVHMRHQLIVYSGLPPEMDEPKPEPRPSDQRFAGDPTSEEDLWQRQEQTNDA
jgi:replicative DNA helicase